MFTATLYSVGSSAFFREYELYQVKDGILYCADGTPYDSTTLYTSLDEINNDLESVGARFIIANEVTLSNYR